MADNLRFRAVMSGKALASQRWAHWHEGVHARYRQLTTEWGMKFFAFQTQRDENYAMQVKLARHGLAPKAKCKFSFKYGDRRFYGFLTEVVEVMEKLRWEEKRRYFNGGDKSHELSEVMQQAKKVLGCNVYDMHSGNYGLLRGKVVLIDFSTMTDELYRRGVCTAEHR